MSTPAITVVTVCRNALHLLRDTVESVLMQDHPGLEYWIVDGASTDGTREYLETLVPRGVKYVSERDGGIADAMNKGIRLATGDLVAHLHAGDHYLHGALAAVSRRAGEKPDADVYCAWMVKHEPGGEALYRCAPELLHLDMTVNHPATWTRREALVRHGGFDARYPNAMDYELFLRLREAGCRFEVIGTPLAAMAGGGQSETSLWRTLRETHAIRRRLLRSGRSRGLAYFLAMYARGMTRRMLQRIGLGGLVRRLRGRFALLPKD